MRWQDKTGAVCWICRKNLFNGSFPARENMRVLRAHFASLFEVIFGISCSYFVKVVLIPLSLGKVPKIW